MTRAPLQVTHLRLGRTLGPSAAEHRYYVLILFDIAEAKKYRALMRILKRYARRIQKSVFEAWLKPAQLREMTKAIEGLMGSEPYFDAGDNVRIYRIAGNCDTTVFGVCNTVETEGDIFI